MKRILMTLALFGMTVVSANETQAFLKIGGVKGDSNANAHQNWFELATFDQGPYRWTKKGGTRNYLPHESGTEGGGKLTITRTARIPSEELYQAATKGTFFGTVTVDVPVQTGMGEKYIRWTLSDVIVTGLNVERAHGKRGLPIEQVTFSYQRAEWEYPESKTSERERRSTNSWHLRG